MKQCLGLFAKHWQPGEVKTRLARTVGDEGAAALYRAFVETTAVRLSELQREKMLAYAPAAEAARIAFSSEVFQKWTIEPQVEGDLGSRMSAFFDARLKEGFKSIVLMGTDSPNVPLATVQKAFQELKSSPVVLGPTLDGGYYLVGISQQIPPIFGHMPWSTSDLWLQTISRLKESGIKFATLQPWYDVDELDDLEQLIEDLKGTNDDDETLRTLHTRIRNVLDS